MGWSVWQVHVPKRTGLLRARPRTPSNPPGHLTCRTGGRDAFQEPTAGPKLGDRQIPMARRDRSARPEAKVWGLNWRAAPRMLWGGGPPPGLICRLLASGALLLSSEQGRIKCFRP